MLTLLIDISCYAGECYVVKYINYKLIVIFKSIFPMTPINWSKIIYALQSKASNRYACVFLANEKIHKFRKPIFFFRSGGLFVRQLKGIFC